MTDHDDKAMLEVNACPTPAGRTSCTETSRSGAGSAALAPQALNDEDAQLGHALRAIYRQTVEEAIPDEMLDLLKRLD